MFKLLFYPSGIVTWGIVGVLLYQVLENHRYDSFGRERTPLERIESLTGFDLPVQVKVPSASSGSELESVKSRILSELDRIGSPQPGDKVDDLHEQERIPSREHNDAPSWERVL